MGMLVQKRFSITATSIPSERLLSSAGMIISTRRGSLLPADTLVLVSETVTNSHTTIYASVPIL